MKFICVEIEMRAVDSVNARTNKIERALQVRWCLGSDPPYGGEHLKQPVAVLPLTIKYTA